MNTMPASIVIKAYTKLNLFLHVIGKLKSGYHLIRTGVTFLDLYDEVSIILNDINDISYIGPFKPKTKLFANDIIVKALQYISVKKNCKIKIQIKKNIPWQAGLGSASTDVAALVRGLQKLGLIKKTSNQLLSKIGADVPVCYYGKNCIATGIGDNINKSVNFPKYYFVLVYPRIHLSTLEMYNKLDEYLSLDINRFSNFSFQAKDNINDFEKIIKNEYKKISELLFFLSKIKNSIFSRMSGSGSCCYVAFNNKTDAEIGLEIISKKYSNYWICLTENNMIN